MKLHNKIKAFYDLDGRDYGYRRWKKYPAARFDYNSTKLNILEYLHDEHFYNALEVGCGPGTWTGILNNFSKKITALDISSSMINKAKEKYKNSNINFLNLDIVDFKNNKNFDLIFSGKD